VPATPAPAQRIAGLDRRFNAFVVDRVVSLGLCAAAAVALWAYTDGEDPVLVAGASVGLLVLLWLALAISSGVAGTTPGKAAFGLRLLGEGTGAPIGVGRALLRGLVLALAGLPTFGFGLAALARTAVTDPSGRRRGWHDHLVGSVVLDIRQLPEPSATAPEPAPRAVVNLTAMRLVPAPVAEASAARRAVDSEHSMRREPLAKDLAGPAPTLAAPAPGRPIPGTPLPGDPRAERPLAPAVRRWRATFDDGQTFVLEGPVLVGRRPAPGPGEHVRHLVPLASPEMAVSKTHAHFGPAPDGVVVVTDRGSTNGTVLVRSGVGRQLTPGRPATLRDGDRVVFGDRTMTLSLEP
jgi:uncharacterized RDD family membrane protein YckC